MIAPRLDHRLALCGAEQRIVFGAKTYRAFARMLASSTEETEVPDPWVTRMRSHRQRWCRRRWKNLDWPNATVVSGDAVDVVTRLKEELVGIALRPGVLRPGYIATHSRTQGPSLHGPA